MNGHHLQWVLLKLNFDECSLGNSRKLVIEGLHRDHYGKVLRAFSKPTSQGLAIGEEILALLEGLLLANASSLSNFLVEDDSTIVIPWTNKKERGPWKFDGWLSQIIDISYKLGCSISWAPRLSNQAADA